VLAQCETGASVFKMVEVSRHKSVDVLRGYVRRRLLKQETGNAVQSSHQRICVRGLIGGLAVLAVLGCDQRVDVLGNSRPVTREDAYSRQVALDVAAIVLGMTRAHGAQAVASLPKWWQDLPPHP
jgi:hypothetical protein